MDANKMAQLASMMNQMYQNLMYNKQNLTPNGKNGYLPTNTGMPFWDGFGAAVNGVGKLQDIWNAKKTNNKMEQDAEGLKAKHNTGGKGEDNSYIGQTEQFTPQYTSYAQPNTENTFGFGNLFGNKQNDFSFKEPSTDSPQAQAVAGETSPQQSEYQRLIGALPSAKYLGNDYEYEKWMADDQASGVKNPLISMMRYAGMVAPLRERAEQDRIREAFRIANDPNYANSPARNEALAALAYLTKDTDLINDLDWKKKERKMKEEKWDRAKSLYDVEDELNSLKIAGAKERLRGASLDNDIKDLNITGNYAGVDNEGSTWIRKDGVDLSNLTPRAKAGLNHVADIFRQMFPDAKSPMLVTSGRDSNKHADGQYSHYTGWKVDIADDMAGTYFNNKENRDKFAKALAQIGVIVRDEWVKGNEHLDLNFQNYHGGNLGNKSNKKNSKETGSKYDSQSLADTINATYTEGKTRGTDAERADIGKKMSGAVGLVASPYDNWQVATEKLYDYYDKTLGAQKGWNLNSEEFSHLVGRAIHDFYLENTGTDIPVNMVAQYIFNKRDPESLKKQDEAKKWKEENKNKPQTVEDEAKKVLGVDANNNTSSTSIDSKPQKVGSKLSQELDKPISFGNIFGKDRKKVDDYD